MLELSTPAQYVKGVGPKLAEILAAKGIATVDDLLHYLPFRYEDRLNPRGIAELRAGEMATVIGEVRNSGLFRTRRMPIFQLTVGQGRSRLRCIFFNATYLQGKFEPGQLIAADGSATLYCSTVDMGQGSTTALAQIAAEALGIEAEAVRVVLPDTDVTPYDMGTLGSRSTFHMGHAVRRAAEEAKAKLAALAAETGAPEGSNLPIAELFRRKYGMQAGTIVGSGSFVPDYVPPDHATGLTPNATPYWMTGGSGAEVEVDTETGHVRVLRLVNVADAGTPINPRIVETQLTGAAVMQLGFTLSEEMVFTDGQLRNPSFADYKIPGIRDMPEFLTGESVAARQESGPYGAKGVGETGTFGVSPAIANAIHDAVGVRLTELPITAEAVYRALRRAAGDPLPEER